MTSLVTIGAMVAAGLALSALVAPAASADLSPVADSTASTVTADVLPTVQINGVIWSQTIVDNTVYAVGSFTKARPAGTAAGSSSEVARGNILSFNLSTGALNTAFNPTLNQQAYTVVASPDKSRIYVGGMFTQVNGVAKSRIAALDPTTGALITSFNAGADFTVKALVATSTTLYAGGAFVGAKGSTRNHLAAYTAATGALTTWAPSVDDTVNAMVLSPDGKIIVGGAFANYGTSPNTASAYGLARLDPTDGTLLPWNATSLIRNAGSQAAILSLKTDGTAIYGTGYVFGAGGNLEGTFSADPATGNINWVEDCHGDTYDNYPSQTAVYTVSHAHYCGNIGGFPQSNPWDINMRHALAFTKAATGTAGQDPYGYYNYGAAKTPTPSLINWFPDLQTGTYTGKTQAAWSITGNSQYVVLGGEFPKVNNVAQQGLARFAIRTVAPAKIAPSYSGSNFVPTILALARGTRISWQENSDRDSKSLTYTVQRNGVVIYTLKADSTFWNRPTVGFIDTTTVPGTAYKYRVTATDSDGNAAVGDLVNYTASTATPSPYTSRVLADGASSYWPMNEASGSVLVDNAGFNDLDVAGAALTRGSVGAVSGDPASTFDGSTDTSTTRAAVAGPDTFTAQAWVKTTTMAGGKILGFGSSQTGNSGSYDRHIYMDNAGHITFGSYPGFAATVTSAGSYNDGVWHQISATLGVDGIKLYVDSKLVGQRSAVSSGQAYSGYWRIGGDNLNGWPSQPSSNFFAGSIDEVAIYPTVLSRQVVDAQWVASGRTSTIPAAPADAYGAAVFNDNPLLLWRLSETSGTSAADSGPNGDQGGTYVNGVTLAAQGAIKGTSDTAAGFDGVNDFVSSTKVYSNPLNFSEEAWFKTTSTNGGKIVGFGNNNTGTSTNYDRHIYMDNIGKVTFGDYNGTTNTATGSASYNDGAWHQVVATQSTTSGMKLYVDGVQVASNPTTGAQSYDGYWKVGGDTQWGCCSAYLTSTIDDVSIYNSVLTPAQIANHYNLGSSVAVPNNPPTAAFSSSSTDLVVSFDGSSSADSDGSVAGYSWSFGDSSAVDTTSGQKPSHTYTAAGSYQVTLIVKDNNGLDSASVSHQITVTAANVAPTASFVAIAVQLTANFDASASTDPDGTIASYAWTFGDGSTGTGKMPAAHTYTAAGGYSVTLTVADNAGGVGTSTQTVTVTAPPVNNPPTAAFSLTATGLTANVDASASTDSDGTITAYLWDFGDGFVSTDNGQTQTHTYATGGSHTVELTVTDNGGASTSLIKSATFTEPPPANAPPVAAFTSTTVGLTATVDGSTSSDSDGTIANYAWDFGDGSTDMGATTKTDSHTYLAPGSYAVGLIVTDNSGATTTVTHQVTVNSPVVTPLVSDTFSRTVTNGLGTADIGGAWALTSATANFSTTAGVGKIKMAAAGAGPTATLGAVGSADVDLTLDMSLDKASTGAGTFVSVAVRKVGTSEYRTTAKFLAGGSVQLQLVKIVNGTSTSLKTVTVAGLSYTAGDTDTLRFQVSGSTLVVLNAKIFKTGTTEPAAWQATATDSSATLSTTGGVALYPYLSGSSTSGAVVATFDNLKVLAVSP